MSKTRSSIWYDDGAQRVSAVLPDGRSIALFLCTECRKIHLVEGSAKQCCNKVGPCKTCGQPVEFTYHTFCLACVEQQAIEAWRQLPEMPATDVVFWHDECNDLNTFVDQAAEQLHDQGLEPSGSARVQQCIRLIESLRPVNGTPFHLETHSLHQWLLDGLAPEEADDDDWAPIQILDAIEAAQDLIDAAAQKTPLYQIAGNTRPAGIIDELLDGLGEA